MSQRKPKKQKSKHVYFYDTHVHSPASSESKTESKKVYYYPRISEFELRFGHSFFEIFLVLLTLTALVGLIIYLIKPESQFSDLRNTQRVTDISQIQDAISQYQLENSSIEESLETYIPKCPDTLEIGTAKDALNLNALLVDTYILEIPTDPSKGTTQHTGYTICKTSDTRLRLDAKYAEKDVTIAVIR